ncbi:MAG: gamma-glutamyltransferase [Alphaproteobacteria bacterium]|nr:gamma-glutamyltransferase [Alphaproteobacteria bacterium]
MVWRAKLGLVGVSVVMCAVLAGVAPPPEVGVAMVAADHPLASQAGAEALRRGGTAVDAAVAAALSAGVVNPAGSGLGGGGFAVGAGKGDPWTLDFREVAPAAAHRDMYVHDGRPDPAQSRVGGLAVAVPGRAVGSRSSSRTTAGCRRRRSRLPPSARPPRASWCCRTSPMRSRARPTRRSGGSSRWVDAWRGTVTA